MLFDQRPKNSPRDMYNYTSELARLKSAIKKHSPLIIIDGLRRTGKTSMLLTATIGDKKKVSDPVVIVDLRVFLDVAYASRKDLIEQLERAFGALYSKQFSSGRKLLNWLKKVKGVQISDRGIGLSWGGKEAVDLASLFDEMNAWAVKEGKHVVVAFDEAQELRKVSGVDSRRLFAHVYDYCRNITLLLTGSAVGLLHKYLGEEDVEAALYGRHSVKIHLDPLPNNRSKDFLVKGFKQAKINLDDPEKLAAIDRAVARLDGIIGWLNLFGVASLENGSPNNRAIEYAAKIGKEIARKELNYFLVGKETAKTRYEGIIRFLSFTPATSWSAIKKSLEASEGRKLPDTTISDLLGKLVDSSFLMKESDAYMIADPLLAEAYREL